MSQTNIDTKVQPAASAAVNSTPTKTAGTDGNDRTVTADSCIEQFNNVLNAAFNNTAGSVAEIVTAATKSLQNTPCSDKMSDETRHALAVVASRRDPKDRESDEYMASVVEDPFLAEAIYDKKRRRRNFAMWRRSTGKVTIEPFLVRPDGSRILPPPDPFHNIERHVILLASGVAPYGSQEQLIAQIKAFVHKYADIPEWWEDLIAHYVLMTWVFDRFTAVPYLRFLGEPGTGKTRALTIARALSYKSILAGGATTASPVFRLIERWGGTFVVDEGDWKNSDEHAEIIKILNQGYMRDLPVLRTEGKDLEPRAFDVFGPKIVSTRHRFADSATEGRCITLESAELDNMREDVPLQLPNDFHSEVDQLRSMLLMWRFDNFWKIAADESKLRKAAPRLGQIGTALYAVSRDEKFRSWLIDYLGSNSRHEKTQSQNAAVIEAFSQLVGDDAISGTSQDAAVLSQSVKDITTKANEIGVAWGQTTADKPWMTPKDVGSKLRSMRFDGKRKNTGYQYSITRMRLEALRKRYGLGVLDGSEGKPVAAE